MPDGFATLAELFVCPLVLSGLLTALLIRWAPHLGLVDYPNDRKVHVKPTPRGGGIAIYVAIVLTLLFLGSVGVWEASLAAAIFLLGLGDDLRPLPWPIRLSIQLAVAILAVWLCLPPSGWLVRAAAVLWIAGLINAFNMLDNMDALSGGVAWIAAGFLAALLWIFDSSPQGGPFVALMGALSGFLWFNRPPARIFMGDAGSTFLGFVLGLGSLEVVLRESAPAWSWLAAPCILAVPCYDLLTVVTLRLSQGRSPFHADKQHVSHRLVVRGLSGPRAVGTIYVLALASGASAVLLYAVTSEAAAAVVVGQLAAWWFAFAVLEFATKEQSHDTQAPRAGKAGP